MDYIIENEKLRVCVASYGAEMKSIISKEKNREYLWQGDPEIWKEQAPNLFPYIARMTDGKYTYGGKTYEMKIHGFLKYMDLKGRKDEENRVIFRLEDSDETREQYPFKFAVETEYELLGNTVQITYRVENKDDKTMYFGIGGHPGFQVPLEEGKKFDDYYLKFEEGIHPESVVMSEDCFVLGTEPYEMEDGRVIRLSHALFDHDAVVLKDAGSSVKLKCEGGSSAVTVQFPGMDYFGIWHKPHTEAAYVCLEPWTSLPSRKGIIEELEKQENLLTLEPGKTYVNQWKITIE